MYFAEVVERSRTFFCNILLYGALSAEQVHSSSKRVSSRSKRKRLKITTTAHSSHIETSECDEAAHKGIDISGKTSARSKCLHTSEETPPATVRASQITESNNTVKNDIRISGSIDCDKDRVVTAVPGSTVSLGVAANNGPCLKNHVPVPPEGPAPRRTFNRHHKQRLKPVENVDPSTEPVTVLIEDTLPHVPAPPKESRPTLPRSRLRAASHNDHHAARKNENLHLDIQGDLQEQLSHEAGAVQDLKKQEKPHTSLNPNPIRYPVPGPSEALVPSFFPVDKKHLCPRIENN